MQEAPEIHGVALLLAGEEVGDGAQGAGKGREVPRVGVLRHRRLPGALRFLLG